MHPHAAALHRIAGIAAVGSTVLLVAALSGLHVSGDAVAVKHRVLDGLFVFWCAAACAVLAVYAWTGVIVSTLGKVPLVEVVRRKESRPGFWSFWCLFALLLAGIGVLFRVAIDFVTFRS